MVETVGAHQRMAGFEIFQSYSFNVVSDVVHENEKGEYLSLVAGMW